MTIKRLRKELALAKEKEHRFIRRTGYQYAREGYQFDNEIEARRRFAVEWRQEALDLISNQDWSYRAIHKNMWYAGEGYGIVARKFHIFSVQGQDVFIVCPSLPSTDSRRSDKLSDESAEEWISRVIIIA